MENRLKDVFRVLSVAGECSFRQLLFFGNFIGVEWSLLYLQEAFQLYDGSESSTISLSSFLQFCVEELNGLDILLNINWFYSFILHLQQFNYVVEGFLVYTNFDSQMKEELQKVKHFLICKIVLSVHDFLYHLHCEHYRFFDLAGGR